MTRRKTINWIIWIAVISMLYAVLYDISPLGKYGLMYTSYIAFPIFFASGGKNEDFLSHFLSYPCGVAWGLIFIYATTMLSKFISSIPATALVVLIGTFCLVALHMYVLRKTPFSRIPAIFGGFSATFSTGGTNIIPLLISLLLGCLLVVVMMVGLNFLDEDGRWIWPRRKKQKKQIEEEAPKA